MTAAEITVGHEDADLQAQVAEMDLVGTSGSGTELESIRRYSEPNSPEGASRGNSRLVRLVYWSSCGLAF